ncbi:hypothetical protein HKX48_008863 [Thoreauomyces humboldtii]|nr:hypothetical protein HKX48_008863 [Thoreauomyces humboldtii]
MTPITTVRPLLGSRPSSRRSSTAGSAPEPRVAYTVDDEADLGNTGAEKQAAKDGLGSGNEVQMALTDSRERNYTKRVVWTYLRNLALMVLCLGGAIVGGRGYIVVANGSWRQTLTGLGFGMMVQIALVPIVGAGRTVCQLWFARLLSTKGMKARQMMCAWSALYSGSYRGVEDYGGISPVAFFLILVYAAEAIVIGAVGNLYTVQPTSVIKAAGQVPLQQLVNASVVDDQDNGPVYEGYVTALSARSSDNWIPLTSESTRVQFMQEQATSVCAEGVGCLAKGVGVFSPLALSGLRGAPTTLPWVSTTKGDMLRAEVTMLEMTTNCTLVPEADAFLYPAYFDYVSLLEIHLRSPDVWLSPVWFSGHFYNNVAPEFGLFGMTNIDVHDNTPPYASASGSVYVVPYAYNFPGRYDHMQYTTEPYTGKPVGFSLCEVTASIGRATADILVTGNYDVQNTTSKFSTVENIEQIGELRKLNFNSTEAYNSYAIMSQLWTTLGCTWHLCPKTNTSDSVPFFAEASGLLSVPAIADDWDYSNHMEVIARRITEIGIVGIGAMVSPDGRFGTTGPGTRVTYGPATVFTSQTHGRVVISSACIVILLTGAVMALLLTLWDLMSLRRSTTARRLSPGVLLTESIFYFLKSFQDSVIHPNTPGNDATPQELRRVMGSKTFLLGQNLLLHRKSTFKPLLNLLPPPSLKKPRKKMSSSPAPGAQKTQAVQGQVDEVIGIMHNNIEKVMARGERLESLQNKTDDLQQGALQFKRGATKVRRQMWWKDLKLKLIIAAIVIVILIIIIVPIVTSIKKSSPSS